MDSSAQTTTINTQTSSASSSRDSSPNTPITPSSPASSAGSGYFQRSSSSAPNSPQVPYHIIVTFDGKVREMLRIERQSEDMGEERRSRRTTPRPRYYARSTEE
ncbi:hypothetical protein BKA58DRAFT_444200 [Alternaria rosae]|uniref:uncharacterized protein n=1 Tax=Alternaria rosae TaxID=1187941 RepID=UPI001E8D2DD9|nr:uncharacterized protein BKA58DRAFT_444200 [Alternaria rosae]KAH6859022.1 hypothetical protein BKA58DRAFT_444200 [Alternaria rosae]